MVAYIAFIASLNLCVGYVLGVYFGVCPGITSERDEVEADNDEVIGLPLAEPARPAMAVNAPKKAPKPEPQRATTPSISGPNVATILEGLGDFKAKLSEVSGKLATVTADRKAIGECAGEMQQANCEYLERTAEAIQSLNVADAAADDGLLHQKLRDQSDEVRRANVEIEGWASEEDVEKVRQLLMGSSEQLTQSAAVIEYTLQTEDVRSSDQIADRAMGTLDSMMALIDQEIADGLEDRPLVVAKWR